jgi:mRNA interferase HicA
MKKKELCKRLSENGWWLYRQGGNHEIWTNGEHVIAVPRHTKIDEKTARGILRDALINKGSRQ